MSHNPEKSIPKIKAPKVNPIREKLINKLENSEYASVQSRLLELKDKINLRESQRRVDYANQLYVHYQKYPNPEVQKQLFKEVRGMVLHSESDRGWELHFVNNIIRRGCVFSCFLAKNCYYREDGEIRGESHPYQNLNYFVKTGLITEQDLGRKAKAYFFKLDLKNGKKGSQRFKRYAFRVEFLD